MARWLVIWGSGLLSSVFIAAQFFPASEEIEDPDVVRSPTDARVANDARAVSSFSSAGQNGWRKLELRNGAPSAPTGTEPISREDELSPAPPAEPRVKEVLLDSIPMPERVRAMIQAELDRKGTSESTAEGGGEIGGGSGRGTAQKSHEEAFRYRVHSFEPGTNRSGAPVRNVPESLLDLHPNVVGPPDFSLATKVADRENLLSLGNGGSIVLEVIDGYLVDGEGPDLAVFENPFVVEGTKGAAIYAETAVVSVSEFEDLTSFRSFPCDARNPPYRGCAGVVPVRYAPYVNLDHVGGDLYDLSEIGVARARFIRIEDTGDNDSFLEGTEGFDLDALALLHTSEKP